MELIVISSMELAKYLITLDYIVEDIEPNPRDVNNIVFYFEDSDDIWRTIDRFIE